MYNNVESASVSNSQQVELGNIMSRIVNANDQLEKMTYSFKEKLQSIYYRQDEQNLADKAGNNPPENCFTQAMHSQLYKLEQSINRLQSLYQHLSQIV